MTEPALIEAKPGELMPCPFCGSECAFEHDSIARLAKWRVYCRDTTDTACVLAMATSIGYARRVEAAEAWNKRPPPSIEDKPPVILSNSPHVMQAIKHLIAQLPDDKAEALHLLDATRRMVVRFKR